ncbi:ABC transporter ATP-binding protein [Gordonia desulfuricans]|uniref:ABC-type quaternary amine transporter n=1 Tax=Gordonia desulfuricans TaxID=89051 RepID=A0A7K3LTJ2_9ACTN|nr:ABC transporter ATP-binding protein [Gordonia desulfuricans]NDK91331.1 ABC transporter ATP-binding protein [Gordonia desulfuricans]
MSGIDIIDVSKAFNGKTVLDEVAISIAEGEFVALLGPSGCGKTTTLRTIAGLENPDSGTVLVNGRPVDDPARGLHIPAHRRDIGMVFQSYALWPHMNVGGNAGFPLRSQRVPRRTIRGSVADALELVGLGGFESRSVGSLSGGQQQRVALARALVSNPTALLLDEPLSNLDAELRTTLRSEFRRIQREVPRTTVYVTHDRIEAQTLADRVVVMVDGAVIQSGSPTEVFGSPKDEQIAGFVGYDNIVHASVSRVHDGHATVRLDEATAESLELRALAGTSGVAGGDPTAVAFRSSSVTLHDRPDLAHGPTLPGIVLDAVRLADRLECLVSVNGRTLRADVAATRDRTVPQVGQNIWLEVDPDAAVLVATTP